MDKTERVGGIILGLILIVGSSLAMVFVPKTHMAVLFVGCSVGILCGLFFIIKSIKE